MVLQGNVDNSLHSQTEYSTFLFVARSQKYSPENRMRTVMRTVHKILGHIFLGVEKVDL